MAVNTGLSFFQYKSLLNDLAIERGYEGIHQILNDYQIKAMYDKGLDWKAAFENISRKYPVPEFNPPRLPCETIVLYFFYHQ